MKATRRPRLAVEHLERRETPVASISLAGSTLFVRGAVIPNDTANGGLQITGMGNDLFAVQDGVHLLGTYRADNVDLLLTSHQQSDIRINLGGYNLNGSLLISLGRGDTSANQLDGVFIGNGHIGGNLTIVGGSGNESILLGTLTYSGVNPPFVPTPGPISIGGSVNFTGTSSNSAVVGGIPGGNLLDTGTNYETNPVTPQPSPVVTIGGSINMVGVQLGIGANTTVGQNVSLTVPPPLVLPGFVTIYGKINGSFTYTGPTNDSPFGDLITVGSVTTGAPAPVIGGNFTATLGNAPAGAGNGGSITLMTGVQVNGNLSLTGGANNSLDLAGANVNGNATLRGNGPVTYEFDNASTVNGNLSIYGDNNMQSQVAPFTGTVGGNVNVQLGNGPDGNWTFAPTGGDGYGGQFYWNSGNGADTLTIGSPGSYQLNVQFGSNDDGFVGSSGAFLSGSVNGGGRSTANVFNQNGATLGPIFTLSNFP